MSFFLPSSHIPIHPNLRSEEFNRSNVDVTAGHAKKSYKLKRDMQSVIISPTLSKDYILTLIDSSTQRTNSSFRLAQPPT
jgi:hypothetical protein